MRWQVGWLPRGFAMGARATRRGAAPGAPLQSLYFGDGLAAFSIFIEPVPDGASVPNSAQVMREGATVALSVTTRDRDARMYLVTVVGEVPLATAERVARSVVQRP